MSRNFSTINGGVTLQQPRYRISLKNRIWTEMIISLHFLKPRRRRRWRRKIAKNPIKNDKWFMQKLCEYFAKIRRKKELSNSLMLIASHFGVYFMFTLHQENKIIFCQAFCGDITKIMMLGTRNSCILGINQV